MKHVNFLLGIPIKLTITAAYILHAQRVVEVCLMCGEVIVPQSSALFDSIDI